MQRQLLVARDIAAHWYERTGGPVPEALRTETAAAWDACPAPVLDRYESLPPPAFPSRLPSRAHHQQPGGTGTAHGQAAVENRGPEPSASPSCGA